MYSTQNIFQVVDKPNFLATGTKKLLIYVHQEKKQLLYEMNLHHFQNFPQQMPFKNYIFTSAISNI
jgi:hypothetical protein